MASNVLLLTQSMIGNFAADEWRKYGIPVFLPFKEVNRFFRVLRRFWISKKLPFESVWYSGGWQTYLKKNDIVIVHMNYLTMNVIKFINKLNPNARVIAWYWNIVDEFTLPQNVQGNCEFWTFDPEDSKKYMMNFNHQYYFKSLLTESQSICYDVFFCGSDVGRGKKLVDLYNELKKLNINVYFKIVNPKSNDIPKELVSDAVPYKVLLDYNMKSKALLEIVRPGQSGATIRLMEALFLKKKFITNNKKVKEEPFYNVNNIFVLEDRDINELRTFIESEYDHSVDHFIDEYDFSKWLEKFTV